MNQVQIIEVVRVLREANGNANPTYRNPCAELADRIEAHGIAPPDASVSLRAINHAILNHPAHDEKVGKNGWAFYIRADGCWDESRQRSPIFVSSYIVVLNDVYKSHKMDLMVIKEYLSVEENKFALSVPKSEVKP